MGNQEKYDPDVESGSGVPGSPPQTDGDIAVGSAGGELKQNLKGRHMQMIAIGGSIGAGLFVSIGGALSSGGPASIVIDFIIVGVMLLLTVNALGELACKFSPLLQNEECTNGTQLYTLSQVLSSTTLSASSILLGVLQWAGTTP